MHPNFRYVGMLLVFLWRYFYVHYVKGILNPLDCPHHMRQDDVSRYREGVVTGGAETSSLVNCGLHQVWIQ